MKPASLRLEIALALLLKVVLLAGLWFLIFRFPGARPRQPPDIAERLLTSARPAAITASPSLDASETAHVRR